MGTDLALSQIHVSLVSYLMCWFFLSGDQSAINELMQMRLRSGGTEGLLAEKLEVILLHVYILQHTGIQFCVLS